MGACCKFRKGGKPKTCHPQPPPPPKKKPQKSGGGEQGSSLGDKGAVLQENTLFIRRKRPIT